ncbi:farnesol dehydrogenase [Tribolium castaneum]|nr:PREDICTED: farnesol dehydrogenase [Tribolium castaneum]|eukprot:XP_970629.1 PREDICTED: farnesol dehydrogenase [Tribolium castaneum]
MVLSLCRWEGKVAVVTGASSGIGAAIADALVENGLIVAGFARRSELIEARAKNLEGKKGKLHAVKTDMSKEDEIIKAFKWVEDNLGHVHILINNAGVSKESFLANGDAEAWRNTFDVNVIGLCIATREAVKSMTANNINGHIIHINSIAGHKVVNFPGINVYSASKYAVAALAETLRHEFLALGSKIKITSISPGLVISEMTTLSTGYSPERLEMLKSLPILKSEDIADAVCYVLSTPETVQINELTITPVGEKL